MLRYVHRTGVGVIAWRQASGVTAAATLSPRDNHRRAVSRGRVVRFAAGYGVVTGAGNASGSLASTSLTAPTATASGSASVSATPSSVSLTAPSATASSGGTGNAFATFMALALTPPEATATGGATATGLLAGLSLTPPSATASGGLSAIYPLPAQVLLGVAYGPTGADYTGTATGSGPTAESIAAAVLAALNATTIPVDARKMNGATINGDGSAGNLWRGA